MRCSSPVSGRGPPPPAGHGDPGVGAGVAGRPAPHPHVVGHLLLPSTETLEEH